MNSFLLLLLLLIPTVGCRSNGPTAGTARLTRPLTLIGLCEDYPEESRTLAAAERDLATLQRLGVTHLRVALGWDGIEPQAGVYDWAFWDRFFDLAETHRVQLIPYVCYTPDWAARSKEHPWRQPPADVARFADFMAKAAARYRGRAKTWELWNEPDNREYWEGSTAEFAALVKAGAAAVRRADPSAKVVLGGISWNADYVIELLADHDIAPAVDIINVHDYAETWNGSPIEHIPDVIGRIAGAIDDYGDNERIWMAEVGYSDFRRGDYVSTVYTAKNSAEHTAAYQGDALVRMLTLAMSTGKVDLFAWYRLNDLPSTQEVIGDVNNRHLGLLSVDGHRKPAYDALARCVNLLGTANRCLDNALQHSPGNSTAVQAHVFGHSDGTVTLVAWRPTGSEESGDVSLQLEEAYALKSASTAHGGPATVRCVARSQKTKIQFQLKSDQTLFVVLSPS